jgi:sugar lactone lactonase YvrE
VLGPNPEADSFSLRMNDGKCDPQGRLWLGSMDMQWGEPWISNPDGSNKKDAGLYCWEGSGDSLKITKKLSDVMISNGLVWNKAGDTFYYTDTP